MFIRIRHSPEGWRKEDDSFALSLSLSTVPFVVVVIIMTSIVALVENSPHCAAPYCPSSLRLSPLTHLSGSNNNKLDAKFVFWKIKMRMCVCVCVLCIGGEIREGMFGRLLLSMLKKNKRKKERKQQLSLAEGRVHCHRRWRRRPLPHSCVAS